MDKIVAQILTADNGQHPVERLKDLNDILEAVGEQWPDLLTTSVILGLTEYKKKLCKINDDKSISYLDAVCDAHDIKLPVVNHKRLPYADAESVHIFARETTTVIKWLISKYPPIPVAHTLPAVRSFLSFVKTCAVPTVDGLTLERVYSSLTAFIEASPHKKELVKILRRETRAFAGSCVSGHLACMAGIIQGFIDVPTIDVNEYEHYKASVYRLLNNTIDFVDPSAALTAVAREASTWDLTTETKITRALKVLGEYTGQPWIMVDGVPTMSRG